MTYQQLVQIYDVAMGKLNDRLGLLVEAYGPSSPHFQLSLMQWHTYTAMGPLGYGIRDQDLSLEQISQYILAGDAEPLTYDQILLAAGATQNADGEIIAEGHSIQTRADSYRTSLESRGVYFPSESESETTPTKVPYTGPALTEYADNNPVQDPAHESKIRTFDDALAWLSENEESLSDRSVDLNDGISHPYWRDLDLPIADKNYLILIRRQDHLGYAGEFTDWDTFRQNVIDEGARLDEEQDRSDQYRNDMWSLGTMQDTDADRILASYYISNRNTDFYSSPEIFYEMARMAHGRTKGTRNTSKEEWVFRRDLLDDNQKRTRAWDLFSELQRDLDDLSEAGLWSKEDDYGDFVTLIEQLPDSEVPLVTFLGNPEGHPKITNFSDSIRYQGLDAPITRAAEWLAAYDYDPDVFNAKYANLDEVSKDLIDFIRASDGYTRPDPRILFGNTGGADAEGFLVDSPSPRTLYDNDIRNTELSFRQNPAFFELYKKVRDGENVSMEDISTSFNNALFSGVDMEAGTEEQAEIIDANAQKYRVILYHLQNPAYDNNDPLFKLLYQTFREWGKEVTPIAEQLARGEEVDQFDLVAYNHRLTAEGIYGFTTQSNNALTQVATYGPDASQSSYYRDNKDDVLVAAGKNYAEENEYGWFGQDSDSDGVINKNDELPDNSDYSLQSDYDTDYADNDQDGVPFKDDLDDNNNQITDDPATVTAYELSITDEDGDGVFADKDLDDANDQITDDPDTATAYELSITDVDGDGVFADKDIDDNNPEINASMTSVHRYNFGQKDYDNDDVINKDDYKYKDPNFQTEQQFLDTYDYNNDGEVTGYEMYDYSAVLHNQQGKAVKEEYRLFDFDRDGEVDALTDGLMFLRYLFNQPVEDIMDGSRSRLGIATTQEIMDLLEGAKNNPDSDLFKAFDLNQDGELDPLTDGMLALRNMFGIIDDGTDKGLNNAVKDTFSKNSVFVGDKDFATIGDDEDAKKALAGYVDSIVSGLSVEKDDEGNWYSLPTQITFPVDDPQSLYPKADSDGDGVPDEDDAFPNDASESVDTDNDGVGDEADFRPNDDTLQTERQYLDTFDRDDDGTPDDLDFYPDDPLYYDELGGTALRENRNYVLAAAVDDAITFLETNDRANKTKYIQAMRDQFPPTTFDRETGELVPNEEGLRTRALIEAIRSSDAYVQGGHRGKNSTISDEDRATFANLVQSINDPAFEPYKLALPPITNDDPDSDGDGVADSEDAFPNDPEETTDFDGDGYGDNSDALPENAAEWLDTDNDGYGDNSDAFPLDEAEWLDTDKDGYGDNSDAFKNDPTEWLDTDGDGVGDEGDYNINDPDIKSERDYLDTFDRDEDGTADDLDVAPDDPIYQTQVQVDEQDAMGKFLNKNSRSLIGSHAVLKYQDLTKDFDFNRPYMEDFLEWRERYVNNKNKMPSAEKVRDWLLDEDLATKRQTGSGANRRTVYDYTDDGRHINNLIAIEGKFFTDHVISERENRMDAVTNWQVTDVLAEDWFQYIIAKDFKVEEGFEETGSIIKEYAKGRDDRRKQLTMLFDALETAWNTAGKSFFSPDGGMGGAMRHMELAWGPVYQEGGDLAIGERVTGPDDPRGEGIVLGIDGAFDYSPETLEPFNALLPNPATRRDWQNMGLGKFINDFVEKYGEDEFVAFATEYKDLINDPLALASGINDVTHSSGPDGIEHNWANGTGGPILNFLDKDYKKEQQESWQGGYDDFFAQDENKKKVVDQYTRALPELYDAIDEGTTTYDLERLINLGASKRLGDLWRENQDEEAFFAAISEYNVDPFIELPVPLRGIEGIETSYDADRLYMKMPGDDDITFGYWNDRTEGVMPLNDPEIRAKFDGADIPHNTGYKESQGAGYFVDIAGGNSEVGDYSMLWIALPEEPNDLEKALSELGPVTDIIQILLSIFGGPAGTKLAMQIEAVQVGLKLIATGELEAEDFASLILYGLVELGEIVLPVDEAAAQAAGEAARPAAEAAAAAEGLLKGTDAFAKFVEGAVAAEVNLALTGIGIAGLNASQSIAVIKAAGSGNIEDVIFPILGELGNGWVQNALKGLGVSEDVVNGLSQAQLDGIYGVVGKMATGDSFEQAITEEVLSYFDDTFGLSGQAKSFFEDFKGDLQNIMRVVEEFIDNPAISDFGEFIVGGFEDIPFDEYIQQIRTAFDGSIESVEKVFDELDIVLDFTKDTVQSVEGVINQMVGPLVANAKIQYDKLPDDVQAKIEKLTNDLDQFVGGPYTNLESSVKEAVKQGMVQRLLGVDGDSLEGEAAIRNAFTREFITVETIASIDNSVVDVLSPGAIATALRAGLNTVLAGQPDADEAMIRAFAQYVKKGIERSIDSGTFAQDFQSWWDTAGTAFDNFEDEEAKVKDVQRRGVDAGTELKNAIAAKEQLEKSLEDARIAALAPDATEKDQNAYIAMMDNKSTYRDDLIAANARIKAANDAVVKIEAEEVTVLEGYNAARNELSLSNQLKEPSMVAYGRELDKSMAEAIDENFNDNVYAQLYDIPEGMTPAQHFLTVGAMAGHATTAEEYNDRIKTGSSEFAMNTLRSAGIDVTKMTDEERQGVTNYLTGTWAKDKAAELGITELEYIEQFNKDFDADFGSADEAAAFITEAMGTSPEQVANTITKRRADRAFDLLGTSYAEMGDILNNSVSYTFDSDTGKVVWGGDGFIKREWDDASGKFVTYQYDMGGAMRYQLNEDGSTPVVPTYEQMPMFRGIDSLAEDDPVAYMTAIASAPPALSELSLLRKNIFEDIAADPDYVDTEGFQERFDELTAKVDNATEDSDYAVPNEDLTYFQRIARDSTKKAQDAITAAEIEVFELGKIPNRTPAQEEQLTYAVERLRDAEESLDSIANWGIRLPANLAMGVNTMVRGIGTALSDAFVNAPLYDNIRANAILGVVDPDNENIKSNQELKDEWYGDPDNWISREFDYSTVVNNDFNTNMLGVESIGYEALPESYRNDVTDFWTNIETAEGIGGKIEALYDGFIDKPDVFLTEVVGMELGQELIGLFGGLGIAKITTKAAMLRHSDEIARALGEKAGFSTNVAVELGDSFGQVAIGSYNEAYAELRRIGYSEADAEAKAAEIAMTNAGMSVLLMSAVPGARALDNKVLSSAGNRALNTFAERLVDGAGVVGKETLNEIFQELGTGIHLESALYNAGVEDRDYMGNIAVSTTLAAVVSPMVTTSIYGLSIPATGVDGSSNNPITGELMKAPKVQELVLAGDSAGLNQYMSDLGFRNDNIIFVDVMDTVDDANYVTTEEARDVYEYYGVEPAGDDLLAISGQGTESTAMLEAEAYWTARYGENTFGTGRTNAQHYDIIQHITDMIDGKVPLDPRFNYDGNMTLSEADLQRYMDNMSGYERDQLAIYDAGILDGSITHEPSGIIEEMGGSLMTTEELQKLQADIATLIDRPKAPTAQEVIDMLLQDPANKAIFTGAITAAVENEFTKLANKEAFAGEVVNQLVINETVKTGSESAIKSVLGDPDAAEAEGIFKIMEDLETQIGLGDTDPVSLTQLIKDKVGSTGTFVDGVYQNDGKGLLGDLTAQGVGRDVAIAQINSILGQSEVKEDDATDANPARPATGLYAIAQDISSMESVFNTINTDYSTVLPNLALNIGMAADDPNNDSGVASGLYAKVAEAIKIGGENKALIEGLLGEYATFEDFKVALDGVLETRINETAALFGNPAQFQYDNEGNIERDGDTGEPLFIEGGEPTGYHAEIYNAMRMQGEDRDNALAALEVKIENALVDVETISSEATASAIKNDVLDVYFPPKPEDYAVGRDVARNLDYIQSMMETGQVDPTYDVAGEIGVITAEDYQAYVDGLDEAQTTALENYNAWLTTPNAISPMLENVSRTTDANFDALNRRVDSVQTGVTDYIRDNVLNVIGVPANDVAQTPAEGLFLAIEEGDDAVLDVLGELGTLEDGVLTGGSGILKDLQLLGMDTTAINDYLTNTLGKPADEGKDNATGIFAAVDANQTTLENIETWFKGTIDALNEVVPDLATEDDKITSQDIKDAVGSMLEDVLLGTELTNKSDVSTAVNELIGSTVEFDRKTELEGKDTLEEGEAEELEALQAKIYLATEEDKLTVGDIKDQLIEDLGSIVTKGQLVSAENIAAAVDLAFGEGLIDYATSTDVMSETAIAEQLQKSLGDVLLSTEVLNASNIASAVDLALGTTGQRLRKEELEAKDSLSEGEQAELDALQKKVYLAFPEDQLGIDDIKSEIVSSLLTAGYLQADDLIKTTHIATAVTNAIGKAEGQVNLAKEGDKITPKQIKDEIIAGLDPYLRANQLTNADDISSAVNGVLGTPADAERRDELLAQSELDEDETAELALLQGKIYLATSDDQLTVGDIKDQLILDLGNVVTTGQLVNADNISAAVDLAFGEGEGLIDYATSTDVMTETAIATQLQKSLGDVLLGTEVVNATNIANAVDLAIGTPTERLRKETLEAQDTLSEGEQTELDALQGKVYLAFPTDQLSEDDIKGQIVTSILEGGYLQVGDLIGTSDIATAVTSAIGSAEGQVNLAKEGDKITSTQIKNEIIAGLDPYLRADQLTSADDISSAVNAVLGTTEDAARRDELLAQVELDEDETAELGILQDKIYLATLGTQIQPEAIRSAVKNELSGILTTDQLVTSENISTAVDSVIGTSEDQTELTRLSQLDTRNDDEQAEFERLSSLLYLATPDDVLTADEIATAVQTDELKNVVRVNQLIQAGDISGAVNAAIGPDGLNLATKDDVLSPTAVADAVTTQLSNMIASGETVSAETIQNAIANQAVAVGQVVSAEQAGLATTEQLTEATQDLATSDDIQMLADLIGKPVNLLTQEDYILATSYLDSIQQDIDVAEADALRYDVTGDQQLTQQDLDLIEGTLDTGDYSQFADTAQFRDTATGMLGREQQLEAELAARDLQIEADRQAQIERDQDIRTQMQTDMQDQLIEQQKREEAEEMFMALNQPGRTRTTKASPLAEIGSIYDFEDIFRDDKQRGFYGSASPYGDNFLDEILNPQQRASGGMVKDKTDEILKIIGDK